MISNLNKTVESVVVNILGLSGEWLWHMEDCDLESKMNKRKKHEWIKWNETKIVILCTERKKKDAMKVVFIYSFSVMIYHLFHMFIVR